MSSDALRQIQALARAHMGELAEAFDTQALAIDARASNVAEAARARAERRAASAHHLPDLVAENFKPSGARRSRGELVGTRAVTRSLSPARRRHLDEFARAWREKGATDHEPVIPSSAMWRAGKLAMLDPFASVLTLPPHMACAVRRAYTTPAREVIELALVAGVELDASDLSERDLDAPIWDIRTPAHRKALAALAVILAGGERTTRPGYAYVTTGFGRGAISGCIPNPSPWRHNRRRALVGRSPERYGAEAMSCADRDRFGVSRGALAILRLWSAIFDLGLEAHQPDGGANVGRHERGIDGRWCYAQYWIGERAADRRWNREGSRFLSDPIVLEWCGVQPTRAELGDWQAWQAERAARAAELARAPSLADQSLAIATDYARAELACVTAHRSGDVVAAVAAGARAARYRILGNAIAPSLARAARRAALAELDALDASDRLAEELARARRRRRR